MLVDLPKPDDPDGNGLGKSWVRQRLLRMYKESVDQPGFCEFHEFDRMFRVVPLVPKAGLGTVMALTGAGVKFFLFQALREIVQILRDDAMADQ